MLGFKSHMFCYCDADFYFLKFICKICCIKCNVAARSYCITILFKAFWIFKIILFVRV